MPRYYVDLTKVRLFPECPPHWQRVPTLTTYWNRQVDKLCLAFPRLFGERLAAVILRRVQESLARGQGLPD